MRASFEAIFGLLRHIDECHDDVVFFADEGGSWQVGVDWANVLPAWFHCLARTAGPDKFGRLVVEVVDEFENHDRDLHIAAANGLGTAEQQRRSRAVAQFKKGRR